MLRKRKASEWIKLDRIHTAIHEAGHAVVALKLGAPWVRLTQTQDKTRDLDKEVAYIAQCAAEPVKGKVNSGAYGYAGIIAESLYRDGLDVDVDSILEWIDLKIIEPSATDWITIGSLRPRDQRLAIERSLEILKAHWDAVRGIAFLLHESDGEGIYLPPMTLEQKAWRGLL
jgi:hypothetical protein